MAKRKTPKKRKPITSNRALKKEITRLRTRLNNETKARKHLAATLISPKHRIETDKEKLMRETVEKRIAEVIQQEAMFAEFIDAEPLEWLHANGTLAMQRSILRHDKRQPKWSKRLRRAYENGDMDEVATEIAEEADATLQEVYTLFFSL